MKKADPEGHYAALNVSPDASQSEIRLAYEMIKQAYKAQGKRPLPKVRAAYDVLRDPRQRARYDTGPVSLFSLLKRPDGSSRLDSVPILVGSVVVLIVALVIVAGPALKVHFTQFDVGDELYWKATSKPFGAIEEYEAQHSFPDGSLMAAYLIRPTSSEAPAWHAARDVHRHTEAR